MLKYLFIFLFLFKYIYASSTVHISTWKELIEYKPENKNEEYIFILDKNIYATDDPGDILSQYKKIKIKSENDQKRIYCIGTDLTALFKFSSTTDELEFTLENAKLISCKYPQVVMEGQNVKVNLINIEFSQNQDSAIQATSVKSVIIKNCTFSKNKKGNKPQIYIENKNNDKTLVTMDNCIGTDNTNDIKDVTSSGGWGYFSNSELKFSNILSIGNKSDNNGAVFNIRYCNGTIKNSEFKNSNFGGKGIIYHYCNIYNTTFHDNQGYGCGLYYVYGTTSDSLEKYAPSNLYNCKFENNRGIDTQRAGAIYLEGAQTVNIYDSIFRNITVIARGGCFQVNGISKITTNNCYFDSIFASDAGAIFNSGYDSHVEVKNCYFKNVYANTGAIINSNSGNTILVEDTYVEGSFSQKALFYMVEYNTKTFAKYNNLTIVDSIGSEGLLYLYKNSYENSDVEFTVTNSTFKNNGNKPISTTISGNTASVSVSAPMINISDVGQSTVLIDNCDFIGNTVNIQTGIGGVLSLNLSRKKPLIFSNLRFINNTVNANGGGLYVGSLDSEDAIIDMKFHNLYFEGNRATGSGGGLYIDNIRPNEYDIFRSFDLKNFTFINNYAEECGGGMVVQSDIFKDTVLENFIFKGNYAKVGGGAYYTSNLESTPKFLPDPPYTEGDSAGFGRFLSSEPSKFEFKGTFENNLEIYSGKELKSFTFELLDAWNSLYVSDNVFSNVKTLTFLAIKIIDEEEYINYGDTQSTNAIIRGNTFELFDQGVCQLDQFKIYGKPGVYYLVFYIPLSGHSNLVHQNLTARVTITDCNSKVTGLYPITSEVAPEFQECSTPKCEGEYSCLNKGNCIKPPELVDPNDPDDAFCECQAGWKGPICNDKDYYEWKSANTIFNITTIILIIVLIICGAAIIINKNKLLFSTSYPWLLLICDIVCILALCSIFFFRTEPNASMCLVYPLIHYISFICLWGMIMFIFYKSKLIVALPTKSNSTSAQISIRQSFFIQSTNNNTTNQDNISKGDKLEPQKQSNQDFSISLLETQSRMREEFIHLILTIIFSVAYIIFISVWLILAVVKQNNGVENESHLSNGEIVKTCKVNYLEPVTYIQLFLLLFGITFTNRKWSLGGYHIDLRHFAFGMANWILCGPFITIITFTMMNDNPSAQLSLYRVSIMLSMTPIIPIIVVPKLLLINDKNVNTDDYSTFAIPFSEKQVSKLTSNYNSEVSNSQTGTGAASSFNQGRGSGVDSYI
ncbi:hypothetical protein BCR36DRAFT_368163 [Piromyces finnis]|uniref:EGF-like domain-containing protein n=1 Tax=Piromyces finnis TaxID=1754191 RepID=A0A1Y1VI12_9FUNG|nr:hypothetical protein BCR36DRAFT_368163 [Piromyces finnis]|eukprot:ORX55421.1 hypothetical protein BCR36DRAFT_368163 [Piromyces finnis]